MCSELLHSNLGCWKNKGPLIADRVPAASETSIKPPQLSMLPSIQRHQLLCHVYAVLAKIRARWRLTRLPYSLLSYYYSIVDYKLSLSSIFYLYGRANS